MSAVLPEPAVRFVLPRAAVATAPPEARGLARDAVRLLVARPDGVASRRFRDLPELLAPGEAAQQAMSTMSRLKQTGIRENSSYSRGLVLCTYLVDFFST